MKHFRLKSECVCVLCVVCCVYLCVHFTVYIYTLLVNKISRKSKYCLLPAIFSDSPFLICSSKMYFLSLITCVIAKFVKVSYRIGCLYQTIRLLPSLNNHEHSCIVSWTLFQMVRDKITDQFDVVDIWLRQWMSINIARIVLTISSGLLFLIVKWLHWHKETSPYCVNIDST